MIGIKKGLKVCCRVNVAAPAQIDCFVLCRNAALCVCRSRPEPDNDHDRDRQLHDARCKTTDCLLAWLVKWNRDLRATRRRKLLFDRESIGSLVLYQFHGYIPSFKLLFGGTNAGRPCVEDTSVTIYLLANIVQHTDVRSWFCRVQQLREWQVSC